MDGFPSQRQCLPSWQDRSALIHLISQLRWKQFYKIQICLTSKRVNVILNLVLASRWKTNYKYSPTSKDFILNIEFYMFSSYYAKLCFMYRYL